MSKPDLTDPDVDALLAAGLDGVDWSAFTSVEEVVELLKSDAFFVWLTPAERQALDAAEAAQGAPAEVLFRRWLAAGCRG